MNTKLINIKYNIIYLLLAVIIISYICFAKNNNVYKNAAFIKDNYGTSFYYDDNNYYNDGWHLIDDDGDGVYEYYYFSLSGHILKDTIAPNGYQLNADGKLIINDILYQVSLSDMISSNIAIFLNKKESNEELAQGFETDYNQVFIKWYTKSSIDITNQLNAISDNLTIQKVNKVRDEISKRVKEFKKIGVWYNGRLYDAKKIGLIDKEIYKNISRNLQKDMSEYINRFREEMGNIIKSMGY